MVRPSLLWVLVVSTSLGKKAHIFAFTGIQLDWEVGRKMNRKESNLLIGPRYRSQKLIDTA
jgi:hypothetical protein